ncbi:MAG TPA: hypothetical protein VKY51_02665, partial [Fredinandcohnia sp.]|nr:hypothetical protein [Fredinandcohnia sp.]
LLFAILGCDRVVDDGVYAFSAERTELRTCGDAPFPPAQWEGEVQTFGDELQIALPTIHLAVGERTLVGRYFFARDTDRRLIANSSFHQTVSVGETPCPTFVQLGLSATTRGETSFAGVLRATYEMDLDAPSACPRACTWAVRFRAERIGDLPQSITRSGR